MGIKRKNKRKGKTFPIGILARRPNPSPPFSPRPTSSAPAQTRSAAQQQQAFFRSPLLDPLTVGSHPSFYDKWGLWDSARLLPLFVVDLDSGSRPRIPIFPGLLLRVRDLTPLKALASSLQSSFASSTTEEFLSPCPATVWISPRSRECRCRGFGRLRPSRGPRSAAELRVRVTKPPRLSVCPLSRSRPR